MWWWGGRGWIRVMFKGTNFQYVVNKPQRSNAQYRQYCTIIM